jgi:hypothetical protein
MAELLESVIPSEILGPIHYESIVDVIHAVVTLYPKYSSAVCVIIVPLLDALFYVGIDCRVINTFKGDINEDLNDLIRRLDDKKVRNDDIVDALCALLNIAQEFSGSWVISNSYEAKVIVVNAILYILEAYIERGVIKINTSALEESVRNYYDELTTRTSKRRRSEENGADAKRLRVN